MYNEWECFNCHAIRGTGNKKRIGVGLDNLGNVMSPDAIRAKIMDPLSSAADGFGVNYEKGTMPDDFIDRGLTGEDLEALVAYLSSLRDRSRLTVVPLFPGTPREVDEETVAFYEIPISDQKFVPVEWWTDENIVSEGKTIYERNCTSCHGQDGKPAVSGAADFTDLDLVEGWSDAYMYWWIARKDAGSSNGWGEELSPEEILQVIVYINSLAYGEPTRHELYPLAEAPTNDWFHAVQVTCESCHVKPP